MNYLQEYILTRSSQTALQTMCFFYSAKEIWQVLRNNSRKISLSPLQILFQVGTLLLNSQEMEKCSTSVSYLHCLEKGTHIIGPHTKATELLYQCQIYMFHPARVPLCWQLLWFDRQSSKLSNTALVLDDKRKIFSKRGTHMTWQGT